LQGFAPPGCGAARRVLITSRIHDYFNLTRTARTRNPYGFFYPGEQETPLPDDL
jgi:hypothetical protein